MIFFFVKLIYSRFSHFFELEDSPGWKNVEHNLMLQYVRFVMENVEGIKLTSSL
jgi:hypothetical protein